MIPIVIAITPTIIGTAIIVALNGSSHKGVLLFGAISHQLHDSVLVAYTSSGNWITSFGGCSLALTYAYNASNTSGHTKKATVNAITLTAFSLGNVVGTETFLPKDAPNYLPGKISVLVLQVAMLFVCMILRFVNLRMNKKKKQHIAELRQRNNWTDDDIRKEREKHAFLDLTDKE